MVIALTFVISRTWISRKGYYRDAPSNHIISSKVALLLALDVLLFTIVYILILKQPGHTVTVFVPNVLFCKFVVTITFCHENVRPYTLKFQPFKIFAQMWSVRSARKVRNGAANSSVQIV